MVKVVQVTLALALAVAANVGHVHYSSSTPTHKAPPIRFSADVQQQQSDQLGEVKQQRAEAQAEVRAAEEAAAKKAADEAAAAAAAQAAAAQARQQAAMRTATPLAPAAPIQPSSQVQQIIVNAFKSMGDTAVQWGLRVARCESGYNPRAYNPAGPYLGLFQFLQSTFNNTPYRGQDVYDASANAGAAAWKYGQGGQSAWGCQ
ncbi:MAG TPA: transglycosylase SLT domain-containing protein [Candidatus Dormibacteraeota bacterium]